MLHGAIAAALTPLDGDGASPDEDAVAPYVDFLASHGVDGVLALGTTGEGMLFDLDERRRIAERFIDAGRDRLQVAVHCGAQTTADTVALAEHATMYGANAVAVIAPPYFALDAAELLAHFEAAARACSPTPFYVYAFTPRRRRRSRSAASPFDRTCGGRCAHCVTTSATRSSGSCGNGPDSRRRLRRGRCERRLPPRPARSRRRRRRRARRARERLDVACDGRRTPAVLDSGGGPPGAREHRVPRRARPELLPPGRVRVPRDDRGGTCGARGTTLAPGRARSPGRAGRSVHRSRDRRRRRARRDVLLERRARGSAVSRPGGAAPRGGAGRRRARAHRRRGARHRRPRDRVRALVARPRSTGRRRTAGPSALPAIARDVGAARAPAAVADGGRGRERLSLPAARRPARGREDRSGAALDVRDPCRRVALSRSARAARTALPGGCRRDNRERLGRPLRHDARRASDRRQGRRR